jgi:hypothetical protein
MTTKKSGIAKVMDASTTRARERRMRTLYANTACARTRELNVNR